MSLSVPEAVYSRLPFRHPDSLGFNKRRLYFDVTDAEDRVALPNIAWELGDFTMMICVMLHSLPAYNAIWTRGNDVWDIPLIGLWGRNNTIKFRRRNDASAFDESLTSAIIVANRWYFVTLTRSGDTFSLYLNNTFQGSLVLVLGVMTLTNHNLAVLKRIAYTNWLDGSTALAMLYSNALTAEQIRYNILNYHNPIRTNLTMWLPIEEGSGLTAFDRSGLGNNGTLEPAGDPPLWARTRKWELRSEAGL